MMKRIIDEVFFDAYAGDELLRGDDAAVLMPFAAGAGTGANTANTGDAVNDSTPANQNNPTIMGANAAVASDAASGCVDITGDSSNMNPSASTNVFPVDGRIAFSTDSFVVSPHFFPGGDIGRLAICGTVNDIATSGAVPLYLSCGFILEEGYPIADLKRICSSMAEAAREAGVRLVTGDTKVVNRGHGDGVFINTSGIGVVPAGVNLSGAYCQPGDKVIVSGTLGDHGITIMSCRESLSFSADIQSDAAPLNHLIADVLRATESIAAEMPAGETAETGTHAGEASASRPPAASILPGKPLEPEPTGAPACPVRCFRDPTRGGLASTLNELAAQSNHPREAASARRLRHARLRRAASCQRGQDGMRRGARQSRGRLGRHAGKPVWRRRRDHRRSDRRTRRPRAQGVRSQCIRGTSYSGHARRRTAAPHLLNESTTQGY